MKKMFLTWLLCLSTYILCAQVTISTQLPPAGFVNKDQLWNIILINNRNQQEEASLRMNLQDASTGQVVLSGNTGSLILPKGLKIVNYKELGPIQYNYLLPDLMASFLPLGSYIICYQVMSNKETVLGEECVRFNIDPLSPPLLNVPADQSTLITKYPQFSWIPPAPSEMFNSLNYDLIVTEVLPGQKAVEAMQYNAPVYERLGLVQPFEAYASSYNRLDTGKIYAWQVTARNGVNYTGKTEVWTFKIFDSTTSAIENALPYVKLKLDNLNTAIAINNKLRLSYFNRTGDREAELVIEDFSKKEIKTVSYKRNIVPGENLIDINIAGLRLPEEGNYRVQLKNSKDEQWMLLFRVKNIKL